MEYPVLNGYNKLSLTPPDINKIHQQILDTATDGVLAIDYSWTILYCNKSSEKILGFPSNTLVGTNLRDSFSSDNNLKFHSELYKAIILRQPVEFEECIGASQSWVKLNAYPSGNILVIYFKDISAKKRKDRLIKRAIDRYNLVLDFTSEAVWEWEIGGEEAYWHGNKLEKLLGYGNRQRSISFWESNVHPEDLKRVRENFKSVLQSDQNYYTIQYQIRKKNGEYIHVRDRATIVRNDKGEAVKVLGVTDDITAQKLNEEALLQAKANYRVLFDNAPLPQWIYDRETLRFLNVNAAAIKHYGYSREEFLQMNLLDTGPEEEHARLIEAVKNNSVSASAWTHQKKNGNMILVEVSVTPVQYKNKNCNLATLNDVTEQKRLQEQLLNEKIEKQKLITKATINAQEKERSEIGRELHDNINQVLASTKLCLEMAIDNDSFKKEWITQAQKQIIYVINEIRFLSKSLAAPVLSDCGFDESLNELVEPYVLAKKFRVQLNCSNAIITVSSDIQLTLYRIIQEQLNNITKHAKAANVIVEVMVDKKVRLLVKDDGLGFDAAKKRHGLGIKNIINRAEAYLGKVSIQSAPNKGCELRVEIPV